MRLLLGSWIFVLMLAALAQAEEQTIVVNLFERSRIEKGEGAVQYINGYHRTISGQTLEYNSSHPDAHSALIVRAQADQSMVWESDTLQRPDRDGFYHLIWLAGLAKGGLDTMTPHFFDLKVNGQPWFHFANRKDSTAAQWILKGKNGSKLSFHADLVDRYGDLFGKMELLLPRLAAKSGQPLTLAIEAVDAQSPDWCMTFQYRFASAPIVRVEPALLKTTPPEQLLRINVDNLNPGANVVITIAGQEPLRKPLVIGANVFHVPVPAVSQPAQVTVICQRDGVEIQREEVALNPLTPRDIYLLPYSHTDIGYTDLQDTVLAKHCRYIDDALRLIEKTKDYAADSRFKWNIEVLWPLETWMQRADSVRKQKFVQAVEDRSIGVNAFYANVLTGLMSMEELNHCFDYAHEFSQQTQIPINTAVISDIPGFVWGTVNALAANGIRYFASATNPFDRIGNILKTWGDKPFWWKSQSGSDSVLFWMPAASYATFHKGSLAQLGDDKIFALMRNLDAEHHPYRIVQLPYTLGDNAGVDTTLSDFVKHWNETYSTPHLIIATHQQMFEAFDKDYGAHLPSYSGDLTPYWEDGAMSTAAEVIMNRQSSNRLRHMDIRKTDASLRGEYKEACKDVILFDEHTWGAANSIDAPDDPQVKAQWAVKRQFAERAEQLSQDLLNRAPRIQRKTRPVSGYYLPGDTVQPTGWTISNEFLTVEMDTLTGGIKHLYSKSLQRDFADSSNSLNRFFCVGGTDPKLAKPFSRVMMESVDRHLTATLTFTGVTAEGDSDRCEIRLVENANRVDITHRLFKKPVRTKESVHIAFPFNVPDGQIRYDVAGAIVRPELDQLPGSNKNFFSVNSWIDVSNKDYGITLATPDIPLAEFGAITAEQPWREHVAPGNTVYSYVLNNYWHTNFKADQSGEIEFHYSLQPHGPFDPEAAKAFGEQQHERLIVIPARQVKH
jgi:alpha-mannosidase